VSLLALTSCSIAHLTRSAGGGSPGPSSQAPLNAQISSRYAEDFATPLPASPAKSCGHFRVARVAGPLG
jgi:hypothetical protein